MKSIDYKSILQDGYSEIIIDKSKFIATVKKVHHEQEAIDFIHEMKKKYWDATHNCSAFLLFSGEMRSSDDGEPAGTAGKPILECIKKNEIYDVAVVITRYFGGIKLGAGGLIRAYTAATQEGIKHSGIVQNVYHHVFNLELEYGLWEKIENYFKQHHIQYKKPTFCEKINVTFYSVKEKEIIDELKNILHGKINLTELPGEFIEVLLQKPL